MTYTIPFSVEESAKDCLIELLDLSQQTIIAEIYRHRCEPGVHSVEFDPAQVGDGLEAGVYIVRLTIGEDSHAYPLQYMP